MNVGFSLLSTKKIKISVENMNDLKQVFENPKQEKKLIQNTLELDSGWSGIMHWCLWQLNCLFKTTFYALGRHTNQSGIFELVL